MTDNFKTVVVRRPHILAAGIKTTTSMEKAGEDCPKLWYETFAPLMQSFPADPARPGESYGASSNYDEKTGSFDYWALMPLAEGAKPPAGMDVFKLSVGLYLECEATSITCVGSVYEYAYLNWLPGQDQYVPSKTDLPCYELYNHDFQSRGNFWIYFPLDEKQA